MKVLLCWVFDDVRGHRFCDLEMFTQDAIQDEINDLTKHCHDEYSRHGVVILTSVTKLDG